MMMDNLHMFGPDFGPDDIIEKMESQDFVTLQVPEKLWNVTR